MKREGVSLFFALAIAVSILLFSIMPGMGNGLNSGAAKHLGAYFALSLAVGFFATLRGWPAPLLLSALASGSYGALIELLQRLVPYRDGNLVDALLNYAGAFLAALLIALARSLARALSR